MTLQTANTVSTTLAPRGVLGLLSKSEVSRLLDTSQSGLYSAFRSCALAVLNCGNHLDDGKALLERYKDFSIEITSQERGLVIKLQNAPADAFVEGKIIQGIREHLVAVVRDVIYANDELSDFDLSKSDGITDSVFHILRNADILRPGQDPKLIVCWGGHAISRGEYDYSKEVGYHLGLRGLNICTGCGPGAMKGPMKGATIGHAKQRIKNGHYVGVSEPGIIAAESPNPIVNDLVILPDIEKRLEAFLRIGHGIIVFPGGVGTMEEILYLLGLLLHPDNAEIQFPLLFTGPASAADYFRQIDQFIAATLGESARDKYQIIIDDPAAVGQFMANAMADVKKFRKTHRDAYHFNWQLKIPFDFQQPFPPTHENIRNLSLHREQSTHQLAAGLRRAFSAIVAGNVKEDGIRAIEQFGLFEIHGSRDVMQPMDKLLTSFVAENRMKLAGANYRPCYRIVS